MPSDDDQRPQTITTSYQRQDQIIHNQLRIGHTRLTHSDRQTYSSQYFTVFTPLTGYEVINAINKTRAVQITVAVITK